MASTLAGGFQSNRNPRIGILRVSVFDAVKEKNETSSPDHLARVAEWQTR
ncbi:hypothetical protein ARTHRO9V_280348 [Arthrobacter sp. 9V]|nr:hypothetical protein ARTHRO9V_280348 [Arthrobacter sp. 9V]